MVGAGHGDQSALGQIAGRRRLSRVVDETVVLSRDNVDRNRDPAQPLGPRQDVGGAQSEIEPAPGGRAQRQIRVGGDLGAMPAIAHRVMGEDVALKRLLERLARLAERVASRPAEGVAEPGQRPSDQRIDLAELETKHRRTEHRPSEPTLTARHRQQGQASAHRVADRDPRPGRLCLKRIQQAAEVFQEGLVASCVTFEAVGQFADRQALTAPVMRQHYKAAIHEIADGLVVFLNRLGAAA